MVILLGFGPGDGGSTPLGTTQFLTIFVFFLSIYQQIDNLINHKLINDKIMLYLKRDLKGVKMQRNPWDQFIKDPENKAKLFLFINGVMILTTFLIVIGTIIFILILVGIIQF